MTTERRGYAIALVVAVVVLVGTVALAATGAMGSRHRAWPDSLAWTQDGTGSGWGPGMMGEGWGPGDGSVDPARATAIAQDWVAANLPGATLSQAISMPMGHAFTVTRDNQVVALLMVDDDTGRVLARLLPASTPTPSGSGSG